MKTVEEIIFLLKKGEIKNKDELEKIKRNLAKKYKEVLPKDSDILRTIVEKYPSLYETAKKLLFRKPTRTLSGVSVFAVMIKPEKSCKHSCLYCPTSKLAPKSYTGYEPSARRARQMGFDPYKQVMNRLFHYEIQGHPTDKCEVIIMGGTFLEMEKEYKEWFIKRVFDAFNGFDANSLQEAMNENEKAKHKVVGITIETRPDVCSIKEIQEMRMFNVTRVELGVQSVYDDVLEFVKRGHGTKEVKEATKLLKDNGFKVCYHIMLNLPLSSPERDLEMFRILFDDPFYKPDMLKIYPLLLLPSSPLWKLYEEGKFTPYPEEKVIDVVANAYRFIPRYVRVMRIQRDIPTTLVVGTKHSNLREIAKKKALKLGIKIEEIRHRESGRREKGKNLKMKETFYSASNGKECFIEWIDENDTIYGFLRLRKPDSPYFEELQDSALVRELHVYGKEAEIGKTGEVQHKGLGRSLLERAEEITKHYFGLDKIAVISGVGVRQYYRRFGYVLSKNNYMVKKL